MSIFDIPTENFEPTRKVNGHLWFDENKKKWAIPKGVFKKKITPETKIYDYSDIKSYELLEDGSSITKGGASLGRAVVGGALFGGVGAVIGGSTGKRTTTDVCNNIKIKIVLRNNEPKIIYINILSTQTPKNGGLYKLCIEAAHTILAEFDEMIGADEKTEQQFSAADEIKKFKELLDCGAITKEEFEKKKKQLLGI